MITFSLALVLLIVGYLVYGKFIDRLFMPDASRKTPAVTMADGVDFIPLPTWKIFMIQFLNIAGLGPIFGAIMGAQFGTASYLWIVFGTIFAGAVHDFFSGALSIRNSGESLPEIIGRYLGLTTKKVACIFTVLLGYIFLDGSDIHILYPCHNASNRQNHRSYLSAVCICPAVYGCRDTCDALR